MLPGWIRRKTEMAVKQRLYTADDISEMRGLFEIIKGEIREVSPSGLRSTILAAEIARLIGNYVHDHKLGFMTSSDGGFLLSTDPDTIRVPDVGFIAKNKVNIPITSGFAAVAPDLVVEVISPSNSEKEIRERVKDYVDAGTQMIWVIYPDDQSADVYTPAEGESANLKFIESGGVLEGGDVLPGLRVSLREVFESLEES
jgi:Uma2 family endonuclease